MLANRTSAMPQHTARHASDTGKTATNRATRGARAATAGLFGEPSIPMFCNESNDR
jgi:hypothetical protein